MWHYFFSFRDDACIVRTYSFKIVFRHTMHCVPKKLLIIHYPLSIVYWYLSHYHHRCSKPIFPERSIFVWQFVLLFERFTDCVFQCSVSYAVY